MSTKVKSIAKYSALITVILVFSKIMGFTRELLIAVKFGATRDSDIIKIATTMPNVLFSCVAAALVTTFIPVFANVKNDKKKANAFFNNILTIVLLICIALAIIGVVIAPLLIKLFAVGFKGKDYSVAVSMTKIVMPSIVFLGISGLYTGYLQSYGIFLQPALTGVAADIVVITGILVFYKYGIIAAIIASLVSSVAQVVIQRPFLKEYKYKFTVDLHDENIRQMFKMALPILITTAVSQINLMVDRRFASMFVAGSISVIDYASRLSTIINQVFIVSITTVLYPMITEKFANRDEEAFKNIFVKSINMVVMVAIPIIFGMVVLSTPLIKLLLQHGKFDSSATVPTSLCLKYLAVGALGYSLIDILGKIFFATKDTFTPMINGFIIIGLNILFIFIFAPKMGVSGLAFASTLASLIVPVIMFIELRHKFKRLNINFLNIITVMIKTVVSGLIMAVGVFYLYKYMSTLLVADSIVNLVVKIGLCTVLGIIVYVLLLLMLKVDEVKALRKFKFFSKKNGGNI